MHGSKALLIAPLLVLVVSSDIASAGLLFGVRQCSYYNSIPPEDQGGGAWIGWMSGKGVAVTFGIDYYRYRLDVDYPALESDSLSIGAGSGVASSSALILRAGARYYLNKPEPGRVSVLLAAEIFKGFGSTHIGIDDASVDLEPVTDALSPSGCLVAFGAEYPVSEKFSLGGDVGLRYIASKMDVEIDPGSLLEDLPL
ncbi:MAG: hypothetical protein OEW00_10935, partial [candidate division Zixibacteria bacterium]|nr:hypothetical protein [candidate division Zixibacteria bacterium]